MVDETDSESGGGSPTIGKRSKKRNKPVGNTPATHLRLHGSPQKFMVYIVEAKLGTNRTVAKLSDLVRESTDYALARNAGEADVIVTGIGMRQRLERSVSAELIVCCYYSTTHLVEHGANGLPRIRSPSSNQSGWKNRYMRASDNHIVDTKLSMSGKARQLAICILGMAAVTVRSMGKKLPPALKPTSALGPNSPANANRLSPAQTRSSWSRLTFSDVPENLI
jgi:hypothetical protein